MGRRLLLELLKVLLRRRWIYSEGRHTPVGNDAVFCVTDIQSLTVLGWVGLSMVFPWVS